MGTILSKMMNWFLIKKRKKVKKINKKQTNFQPMTVCCLCVCEKERERERERERGVWKYSTCHSFHSVTCLAVGVFFFGFFLRKVERIKSQTEHTDVSVFSFALNRCTVCLYFDGFWKDTNQVLHGSDRIQSPFLRSAVLSGPFQAKSGRFME